MKEILLTRGKVALVDDEDYDKLSKYSWYAKFNKGSITIYAGRGTLRNYTPKGYLMHREILGVTDPKISIDHIDGNGLNNQKSNLRICNHTQNLANSKKRKNTISKYRGLTWDKPRNCWQVRCTVGRETFRAGRYKDEIEAALVYNVMASFAHREFAHLNKIER